MLRSAEAKGSSAMLTAPQTAQTTAQAPTEWLEPKWLRTAAVLLLLLLQLLLLLLLGSLAVCCKVPLLRFLW